MEPEQLKGLRNVDETTLSMLLNTLNQKLQPIINQNEVNADTFLDDWSTNWSYEAKELQALILVSQYM